MNEQIEAILDRLEAAHVEMMEHLSRMRALLQRDDREWPVELEKYYTVRNTLLEADKELAHHLRSREHEA
jgi:hypothetical protein